MSKGKHYSVTVHKTVSERKRIDIDQYHIDTEINLMMAGLVDTPTFERRARGKFKKEVWFAGLDYLRSDEQVCNPITINLCWSDRFIIFWRSFWYCRSHRQNSLDLISTEVK